MTFIRAIALLAIIGTLGYKFEEVEKTFDSLLLLPKIAITTHEANLIYRMTRYELEVSGNIPNGQWHHLMKEWIKAKGTRDPAEDIWGTPFILYVNKREATGIKTYGTPFAVASAGASKKHLTGDDIIAGDLSAYPKESPSEKDRLEKIESLLDKLQGMISEVE